MERTNSSHINYRYGICLNDNCPKCKTKEVQQVSIRKDFVCSECGKALMECPPPKAGGAKKIIISIVILVVIVAIVGFFILSGKKKAPQANPLAPTDSAQVDSAESSDSATTATTDSTATTSVTTPQVATSSAPAKQAMPAPASAKPISTSKTPAASKSSNGNYGTVNLGYATYTGDLKDGKPHGQGTLTFKSSHKIVSSKDYVASPGDRFQGEFRDGMISSIGGYWYHDGNTTYVKP